ncbi:MAG: SDR family oxidoreductase [Solirubrobacteraceae bacterium]|nr:SDR family oxidoreductase [Solirubrobacteraceae bacterium]
MATKLITGSRVVAITGAARGIGLATAKAVYATGAKVAIADIDEAGAKAAAASLGDRAFGTFVDVTDFDSFAAFIAATEDALGPVDVLDNNAGIMPIGPFLEETPETAERQLTINVLGVLNGMKAVLPGMLARGRGHIFNTASAAGKTPVPGGLTYAATKAAIVSATETARVEYRNRGIHFTCVMPSFTNTDLIAGTNGTRFFKNAEPEDVAAAIVDAIENPRPDIYVPGTLKGMFTAQKFVGRGVRDALNRAIKADRTFLEIDRTARAGYENRIAAPEPAKELAAAPSDDAVVPAADPAREPASARD